MTSGDAQIVAFPGSTAELARVGQPVKVRGSTVETYHRARVVLDTVALDGNDDVTVIAPV